MKPTVNIILHKSYHCSEQGCPGHKAHLKFNSIQNVYEFYDGKNNSKQYDTSQLDFLINELLTIDKH